MPYELWWSFGLLAWVAVALAFRITNLRIRTRHRLAVREMLHKERLLAIERGVPLPEIPVEEASIDRLPFDRRRAMRIAILFVGAGIGIASGFLSSANSELHDVWSLGFIPIAIGGACAAAAWTTRS